MLIKVLYDSGASLNAINTADETPISLSAESGLLTCVQEIFLCVSVSGAVEKIDCERHATDLRMTPFLLACKGEL